MEIELIKANHFSEGSARKRVERLRVAAYCRVSTDDEDQIKSYNSMVRYYTDLIQSNKDWIFAGVYADKAITGTKIDKRDEFGRVHYVTDEYMKRRMETKLITKILDFKIRL